MKIRFIIYYTRTSVFLERTVDVGLAQDKKLI